jgi:hypothetical protein
MEPAPGLVINKITVVTSKLTPATMSALMLTLCVSAAAPRDATVARMSRIV